MVKVKRWRSADLVVGGYLGPPGDPWSLLLGVYVGQGVLHHVGQCPSPPENGWRSEPGSPPSRGVGASAAG